MHATNSVVHSVNPEKKFDHLSSSNIDVGLDTLNSVKNYTSPIIKLSVLDKGINALESDATTNSDVVSSFRDKSHIKKVSDQVWIEHPEFAYIPAVVISRHDDGQTVVQLENGEIQKLCINVPMYVTPSCLKGVNDLLALGQFDLGPILHNIRLRYAEGQIYTAIGFPILISVNPYTSLNELYNETTAEKYRAAQVYKKCSPQYSKLMSKTHISLGCVEQSTLEALSELPPHVYRVAQTALNLLFSYESDQSIIISGESGAGKTEATKIIIGYIANVADKPYSRILNSPGSHKARHNKQIMNSDQLLFSTDPVDTSIEIQIAESNHLLETFGNAKTLRNDNSSRFGKFTQIFFDMTDRRIIMAQITQYLLEKSRIIRQQPQERNYHVFYQLCQGRDILPADLQSMLDLRSPEKFKLLQNCTFAPTIDDYEDFQHLLISFNRMQFKEAEIRDILCIVASILHLGEVNIVATQDNHHTSSTKVEDFVQNMSSYNKVCELLGLDENELLRLHQYKSIVDPVTRQLIYTSRSQTEVNATKASVCRGIYDRLFQWLVDRINKALSTDPDAQHDARVHITETFRGQHKNNNKPTRGKIGLLDIFGFEVFDLNSFEQLCINFANEKLQQHFNAHMFHEEQLHYEKEGIDWTLIRFEDNQKILNTLTDRITGIFPILDSECILAQATDQSFLSKIMDIAPNTDTIITYKGLKRTRQFGINHYAGPVIYSPEGLINKNRDRIHTDVFRCFEQAKLPLLQNLFRENLEKDSQSNILDPINTVESPRRTGFTQTSVSFRFRRQLDSLLSVLGLTTASYIRCIKPNAHRAALQFDSIDILRQLKCAGILESVRIRKDGYPIRVDMKSFSHRYKALLSEDEANVLHNRCTFQQYKTLASSILERLLIIYNAEMGDNNSKDRKITNSNELWQIGHTRLFLKENFHHFIEKQAEKLWSCYVTMISKVWKGYKARQEYQKIYDSALLIQSVCQFITLKHSFENHLNIRIRAANTIADHWLFYKEKVYKSNLAYDNNADIQICNTNSQKDDDLFLDNQGNEDIMNHNDNSRGVMQKGSLILEQNNTLHTTLSSNKMRPLIPPLHDIRSGCSNSPLNLRSYRSSIIKRNSQVDVPSYDIHHSYSSHMVINSDNMPFLEPRLSSIRRSCEKLPSSLSTAHSVEDSNNSDLVTRLLGLLQKQNMKEKLYEEKLIALQAEIQQHICHTHKLEAEVEAAIQNEAELRNQIEQYEASYQSLHAISDHQRDYIAELNAKLSNSEERERLLREDTEIQSGNIQMLVDHLETNSSANDELRGAFEQQLYKLQEELDYAYSTISMRNRRQSVTNKRFTLDQEGKICQRLDCRRVAGCLEQLRSAHTQKQKQTDLMNQKLYLKGQNIIKDLAQCTSTELRAEHIDELHMILKQLVFPVSGKEIMPKTQYDSDSYDQPTRKLSCTFTYSGGSNDPKEELSYDLFNSSQNLNQLTSRTFTTTSRISKSPPLLSIERN